ncbi:MAG: formylglycine-generating enzyme family protein [Geminicoccaceae bacterium]
MPNSFGVFDTAGNLWELTEDHRRINYDGASSDGHAWLEGNGFSRMLRGGSWFGSSKFLRSAVRTGVENKRSSMRLRFSCRADAGPIVGAPVVFLRPATERRQMLVACSLNRHLRDPPILSRPLQRRV